MKKLIALLAVVSFLGFGCSKPTKPAVTPTVPNAEQKSDFKVSEVKDSANIKITDKDGKTIEIKPMTKTDSDTATKKDDVPIVDVVLDGGTMNKVEK